jgi:hypothetical protein
MPSKKKKKKKKFFVLTTWGSFLSTHNYDCHKNDLPFNGAISVAYWQT